MNDNTKPKVSALLLFRALCAGLKIILKKGGYLEAGKVKDLPTLETSVDSNLSLDRENGYSLAKGLTTELMETKLAKEYFDAYKAATGEDPYATRRNIVSKAIEEFLPNRKDLLAKLFELIIFDETVSDDDDYDELDHRTLNWSVENIASSDSDLYFNYLSPLLVKLFEDETETIGSLAARAAGLSELSFRKDRAIIPILKRLYHQPEHPFHLSARRNLYTAVENFPECFTEPEYLKFKETAKRVRARMLANFSS